MIGSEVKRRCALLLRCQYGDLEDFRAGRQAQLKSKISVEYKGCDGQK